MENQSTFSKVVKIIGAVAAVIVGFILLISPSDSIAAESIFIGTISLVCGVYIFNGLDKTQGRIVATVLFLLALYAFAKAFDLFDTSIIRRVAGGVALISGFILLIPLFSKKEDSKDKTTDN